MKRQQFLIDKDEQIFKNLISFLCELYNAGQKFVVTICGESRTAEQNRKLWPMLEDFARQVRFTPENPFGRVQRSTIIGTTYTKEQWKAFFVGAIRRHDVHRNPIDGQMMVDTSSSNMSKQEFSELIEFIYAEGTERGVRWSEPALETYQEYRQAN